MARADLFLKPLARIISAVAEQDCARRNLPDKLQQIPAVRMRGQIEIQHFALRV